MLARCVHNRGSDLGEPAPGHLLFSTQTRFALEVGKTYPVLGLGLFKSTLIALVCDETGKPNWLPTGLFDINPQQMPDDWRFALLDGAAASGVGAPAPGWTAVWGYPRLVEDRGHIERLVEREPGALAIFFDEVRRQTSGT